MQEGVGYDAVMLEERLVTAEELLAMGEGRRELIAGRVVEMSAAGCRHGVVAVNIVTAVRVFTGKSGRGLVLSISSIGA